KVQPAGCQLHSAGEQAPAELGVVGEHVDPALLAGEQGDQRGGGGELAPQVGPVGVVDRGEDLVLGEALLPVIVGGQDRGAVHEVAVDEVGDLDARAGGGGEGDEQVGHLLHGLQVDDLALAVDDGA